MFLRRKRKLTVDLGELEDDIESLSNFLRSKLKVDVTSTGNKMLIDSENLSSKELKRLVTKFLYRRNLMNKYWVALKGDVVKINKFKRSEKHEKRKGKGTSPSTVRHVMKIKNENGSWETIPLPLCPDCFTKKMRERGPPEEENAVNQDTSVNGGESLDEEKCARRTLPSFWLKKTTHLPSTTSTKTPNYTLILPKPHGVHPAQS